MANHTFYNKKVSAVFKYYAVCCGVKNAMWEVSVHPNKMGWIVTKDEAKKMIKDRGLELAYKDENGEIYDSPDRAFLNKFKNKYAKQSYERDIH